MYPCKKSHKNGHFGALLRRHFNVIKKIDQFYIMRPLQRNHTLHVKKNIFFNFDPTKTTSLLFELERTHNLVIHKLMY